MNKIMLMFQLISKFTVDAILVLVLRKWSTEINDAIWFTLSLSLSFEDGNGNNGELVKAYNVFNKGNHIPIRILKEM